MEVMSEPLPVIYLARHGETAWSISGQHTGLTDLPLTDRGERNARRLADRLKGLSFRKVFTSPLQRATRTCELAGFGAQAEIDRDLLEWNYGEYEGRRTEEIHAERGRTGNCFATAVLGASHRSRSGYALTEW
jgi:broad specificity phosphatase PhoE